MIQAPCATPPVDEAHVVAALNSLLQLEQEMTDAYQRTIDRLRSDAIGELFDCLYSHQLRVEYLSERILELHGEPATHRRRGLEFAGAVPDGDRRAMLLALRDGEARCLDLYRDGVLAIDAESLRLAERELFPEQHRTLHVMDALFRVRP